MKFNIFKTFFFIIIFFNTNFSYAEILKPNISILPSEVVKIQLSSLQNNNSPNIDSLEFYKLGNLHTQKIKVLQVRMINLKI